MKRTGLHAEHTAAVAEQSQHGGMKNQRATVRDTSFDDEIWSRVPNDFLQSGEILRELNHRPTKPSEIVSVIVRRYGVYPIERGLPHGSVFS